MAIWTEHRDWTGRRAEVDVRGATPPNPAKFRVLLCNGTTITSDMSKAAIASAELLQESGYQRQAYLPGQGSYNAARKRYEFPTVRVEFDAAGASLQWSAAVLWADSNSVSSKIIQAIDTGSDRLTIPAHGLINGDEVAVTSTGAMPGGVMANTVYWIKVVDVNTVELHTSSGLNSLLDLTSAGSGTINLRLCSGTVVSFANFQTQLIGDSASQPVEVAWAYVNPGNVNGV